VSGLRADGNAAGSRQTSAARQSSLAGEDGPTKDRIGALATKVQWLCGLHVQAHGLARSFQANTERRGPVLSTVFLGQQFLNRYVEPSPPLDHEHLHAVFALLIAEAADA
jgi:hypothetical protein